eukprot:TRINITY_DN90_c0_g1_i2.p1 TRINITY_DN90_c0_g1~~TRINITY_DN90_c0_g1_i2.p1  ORF type:complete len:523 (+),score=94.16 TRINITY_DN90_c0_g1_i2:32-1600(+)
MKEVRDDPLSAVEQKLKGIEGLIGEDTETDEELHAMQPMVAKFASDILFSMKSYNNVRLADVTETFVAKVPFFLEEWKKFLLDLLEMYNIDPDNADLTNVQLSASLLLKTILSKIEEPMGQDSSDNYDQVQIMLKTVIPALLENFNVKNVDDSTELLHIILDRFGSHLRTDKTSRYLNLRFYGTRWLNSGKCLGTGAYGSVYEGIDLTTAKVCALKVIDMQNAKADPNLERLLQREIEIMKKLKHENIVDFYGTHFIKKKGKIKKVVLAMEYCNAGDLTHYRRAQDDKRLSESEVRELMKQIASAFKYMHTLNVIHRDIKPDNILLQNVRGRIVIKIADFGHSRILEPFTYTESGVGSLAFMAPEVVRGQEYSSNVDLWSIGVVLFELLTGKLPYLGDSAFKLVQKISEDDHLWPETIKVSPLMRTFVNDLLTKDPTQRMAWDRFFDHRILTITQEQDDKALIAELQRTIASYKMEHKRFKQKLQSNKKAMLSSSTKYSKCMAECKSLRAENALLKKQLKEK